MIALDVHLPEVNPLPPDMVSDMFGHLFFASGVCVGLFACLLCAILMLVVRA